MKKKRFEAKIYYTTFSTHEIEAVDENEAILEARKEKPDLKELLNNLENWEEADTAELETTTKSQLGNC